MWHLLKCSRTDLNLRIVLNCGQSFRWSKFLDDDGNNDEDVWIGILQDRLWLLKQNDAGILYKIVSKSDESCSIGDQTKLLHNYFQLDVDVKKLYDKWGKSDKNLSELRHNFYGVRILRQDPVENLFSFICSQNNNISRITQLVEKLCVNFGTFMLSFKGNDYYSFPTVSKLAKPGVEEQLRALRFGYRAKFIHNTAKYIEDFNGGSKWLYGLRDASYRDAKKGLCCLPGVGAKVADCVCLMSLDKTAAIPVDTHMWQVAIRDYLPHLSKHKTLTDKTYREISEYYQNLYGEYAGWAHSVLFSAELKKFQDQQVDTETKVSKVKFNKRKVKNKSEESGKTKEQKKK